MLTLALFAAIAGCGGDSQGTESASLSGGVEMLYVVETEKSPEQAVEDLTAAAARHEFGVLNMHDLRATLDKKGHPIANASYVLDVCNPEKARQVLAEDIGMSIALPCRVAIYEEEGKTKIGMIRPAATLSGLSDSPTLQAVADEVETALVKIIEEAR
jgi:uncharacterized protein (DUF302 family)